MQSVGEVGEFSSSDDDDNDEATAATRAAQPPAASFIDLDEDEFDSDELSDSEGEPIVLIKHLPPQPLAAAAGVPAGAPPAAPPPPHANDTWRV